MTQFVKSTAIVAAALWVGVLFCLGFMVAPYLFILAARSSPSVPNTGVAADIIGPLLYGADIVSFLAATGLVTSLAFLRQRGEIPLGGRWFVAEVIVGIAVVCSAANHWWIAPGLKAVQEELAARYGAFHQADSTDPLVARFSELHSYSTLLFLAGLLGALVCLVCMTRFQSRQHLWNDTRSVGDWRRLRFSSIDDCVAEVHRIMAAAREGRLRSTGNWSPGQVLAHVASWIEYAYEGFPVQRPPFFVRWILRLRLPKMLDDGMPRGVRIPGVKGGTTGMDDMATMDAADRLLAALARLGSPDDAPYDSPAFGPLSHENRTRLNLRHAELHLGYLSY